MTPARTGKNGDQNPGSGKMQLIPGHCMRPMLAAALCVALAACGDGPTAPDSLPTPPVAAGSIAPGVYFLSVATTSEQPCTGSVASWGFFGPAVGGTVTLSREADGWIGRAESPQEGDIELRLRATASGDEEAVSGSLRGRLNHFLDRLTFPPSSVVLAGREPDGSAAFTGRKVASVLDIFGNATGEVTFTHSSGTTVSCREVTLLLSPAMR